MWFCFMRPPHTSTKKTTTNQYNFPGGRYCVIYLPPDWKDKEDKKQKPNDIFFCGQIKNELRKPENWLQLKRK